MSGYQPGATGRLSVRVNDDTCEALTRLVVADRNATEVTRRAIALLDVVTQYEQGGLHLEMVSKDGETRHIIRLIY